MKHNSPPNLSRGGPDEMPVKVEVAFRALAYCRSVSEPHSIQHSDAAFSATGRRLTSLERGMEASALNLVRNYLNGEILLGEDVDAEQLAGIDLGLASGRIEGVEEIEDGDGGGAA